MPEDILVERRGAVELVTLNRPTRKNAWTARMGAELFAALAAADDDDAVRAIVVTGAGGAFCAGADLAAGESTFSESRFGDYASLEERTMPWRMATPVIAAIDGPAVGVGATVPLLWDIRLASDRARIGLVFPRRGLCPEANSTWVLPRLIGASRALELMLTGRILDAQAALAFGLVSRVVPHTSLLDEAIALGHELAEHTAPVAVGVTKRLIWRQLLEDDPRAAKEVEDALFRWLGTHRDVAEGIRAFLDKRPAAWTGRKGEVPPLAPPVREP